MNPQSTDPAGGKLNDSRDQRRAIDLRIRLAGSRSRRRAASNLRFPKEIILLGGAPGAGKGTNTAFIAKTRSLTCGPIVMSALLDSPEARALKDAGNMVGDREVVGLLLRELLRAGVSRRRDHRRLSAHHGAGRVPEAAGRQDARAAARVLQHAAQHPFPASDHSHHGAVRRREGIDRAPAEARPRNARPQRGSAAHRRRPVARGSADRPRRSARAAALPGVQGADLGRAPVARGDLPLPFRQRPGAVREGRAEHPAGAPVSEHARARPAHRRTAARRARGERDHRARAAGTGEAARQLRAGVQRALRQGRSRSSNGR